MTIEPATVLEWKECSFCAVGAGCLADGPFPDAEVVGVALIAGAF
ncbi:subtilosin A family bacteriocin [Actinomyces sp. 565]|nr:subtilosin A family bacteriocin [Actinomyces sp. 565]